jgi:succinate dehydrogenase / fumarate reductase membrane anchor subunit
MTTEVNAAAVGTAPDETPLTRVPAQGSAREGGHHWWEERLSALATFLLFVWFGVSLLRLGTVDHATLTEWLSSPLAAVPMLLLIVATFWHIRMGLQVIVDDYVHDSGSRLFWTMLIHFAVVLAAAFALFAVVKIALGGAAG